MLQRIAVLCFWTVFLFASSRPSSAINIRWDDDSGSTSKLWSDNGNWNPDETPNSNRVFIGSKISNLGTPGSASLAAKDDVTLLDQGFSIGDLFLSNGADIINSADGGATGFALQVNGHVSVSSGQNASDSIITLHGVSSHGGISLTAETMQIATKGRLRLDSVSDAVSNKLAILDITDGVLDNIGGTSGGIFGNGLIRLKEDVGIFPTTVLRNDSIISAGYINSFIIGTPPPATTLQITATAGQARFDWDGTFEAGTLQVGGNATLDIDVSAGNDAFDGTMNLSTGSTIDIAHAWTFGDGGGTGSVDINVNTQTFAITPIGQDPAPGPAAHIAGANWTMVEGTINLADKWDTLHIDSAVSATGGTIENAGTIVFNANASFGSGVDFKMNGGGASLIINAGVNIATPNFNLDGTAQLGNVTTINSGGVLNMALSSGADQDFNHTINLNGGQLQVATTDDDWSLEPNGKINAAGGGTSIISGETFNVHGKIDVSGNSVLQVNADSAYSPTANVVIEAGSALEHSGQGAVTYGGGSYTGGGVLRKGNATITGDTTWNVASVDLDYGYTQLNANLTINADSIEDPNDGFDGLITIDDLATLTVNMSGGEWTVDAPGTIIYNGNLSSGTFLAGSTLNLNGTLENHGNGKVLANLNIGSTAVVDIVDATRSIQLFADTTVAAGATFTGDGTLFNVANRNLRLEDGADVDVIVANQGTLSLGDSAGQASGLDFIQTNQGTWDLEVGGTALNDFDFMTLSGTALLDGTLDLSLIMGFVPSLGDTFSILTAAGGVTGMFDSFTQPETMPSGLLFDVNYFGSIVQLEVISSADFDKDGDVDADDLAQWQSDFGGPGSDADGDGDSDGFDFLAWQQQFGSGVSVMATSTSVPEPSTLFLTGLAASFGLLMPRCKKSTRK